MKLYILKHKNTANNMLNFYPLSLADKLEPNGMYPIAVHAFFKRKEAIKYIESIWEPDIIKYYELISVEIK